MIHYSCLKKEFEEECHAVHRYSKANSKYMRDYDKNKESAYLKYWNENNLNDNDFKKKNCNEEKDEGFFLKVQQCSIFWKTTWT